jgi:hypothetical protein
MYIDWQTLITIGGGVSALGLLLGIILKIHKWYLKQDEQTAQIEALKKHHEEDVHRLKEENCLICFALSACLDGLQQLGANHTVPIAKDKLDKYLNQQAHE